MAQNTSHGPRRPLSTPASSTSPTTRRCTGLRSPRLHALATVLLAAVLGLGILKQASTWAQDSGTPAGSPAASPTVTITWRRWVRYGMPEPFRTRCWNAVAAKESASATRGE